MSTLQGCNDYSAKIDFVPNPLFEYALAEPALAGFFRGPMLESSPKPEEEAVSKRTCPLLRPGLCEASPLTRQQEIHLFREMNFLKFLASVLRNGHPNPSEEMLSQFKHLLEQSCKIQGQIIKSNLGLVVSIAKGLITDRNPLPELISDGNESLLKAVRRFDFARGYKFSTYATWAIRTNFRRSIPEEEWHQSLFLTGTISRDAEGYDFLANSPDPRTDEWAMAARHKEARGQVEKLLKHLSPRELTVIKMRFGLNGENEWSLVAIGRSLGISKERVRQIESQALERMQKAEEFDRGLDPRLGRPQIKDKVLIDSLAH